MQYLLKITLKNTPMWRLIAVDGTTDIAHVAHLMNLAFGYENECSQALKVKGELFSAGSMGKATNLNDLKLFDSLNLHKDDEFIFIHDISSNLEHHVLVMKDSEHLWCLMPSCLVGQGALLKNKPLSYEAVCEYLDADDTPSLDLREVTNRMRAYGAVRKDKEQALKDLSIKPLDFKIK